ncbi:heavy-metal-associated domain-containing protein [Aeromicrobium sp. CTD01-1L150]|uniref:heavy-metal-associated domain-containing protein n=1 Tax=Aeromicrobium sp. CTD01-1L150 TaxID=3341830 RepID=UPI0035BEEE4C
MGAPARLGLYGAVLLTVFAVAFVTANTVVPESTVQSWSEETADHTEDHGMSTGKHQGAATGLTLESSGYRLTDVTAPTKTDEEGDLALTVQGPDGEPVTDFEVSHEKELHLIVVRTDGTGFRHVHPERDTAGRWSIPWTWQEAGSYRVYAEFVPADTGNDITLSAVVHVGGNLTPSTPSEAVTATETDGYEVSVDGDLVAGEVSTLTVSVARDGEPVTTLEPYLGAYGHLVALRDGDLAYLHVHPHGAEPRGSETSGPDVVFEVTTPTPGRYLLYLDFQVAGEVHTAELVLETTATALHSPASHDGDGAAEHGKRDSHDHDE